MDYSSLTALTRETCAQLPAAQVSQPFSPEYHVWKVRGKMFAMLVDAPAHRELVLKVAPEDAALLRKKFVGITEGYHMNKRHWSSVLPDTDVEPQLVRGLLVDAYCAVVAGLPRARRPVDPATFGL
ncbi:MmcQ/YjbR family DNA-binding protein [Corynebacterium incognita]|uniref:MmcQ/YjbR family DNA-binding protein n=1 Tax=Corynebacterium incognita TaxID=2754725 RepID=A0A7G7CRK4_9CORY|nr:MmcQ/YjbR family DNA-binding protein [Corynebacterium incognita]QNE90220.1 MmcQ/YjbR family DNA-binding protein [Corynebacterium incognita]